MPWMLVHIERPVQEFESKKQLIWPVPSEIPRSKGYLRPLECYSHPNL